MCKKTIFGFMAAHSISNAFYILRKDYSSEDRKEMLLNLCNIIDVVDIDKQKIIRALQNEDFSDFENCLQAECAKIVSANYIITRNIGDFSDSEIPAILPEVFLSELQ